MHLVGAGSGKTFLACALIREYAALGRSVLHFGLESAQSIRSQAAMKTIATAASGDAAPSGGSAGQVQGACPAASAIKLLVVPRHPQRFDAVASLARQHGLSVSRRSGWPGSPASDPAACAADVWLGDSLGEMALYYGLSSVALLGGSFAPLGGQNLIEAAACGCPVVMGPHTFNFLEAAALAEAEGAALRVADVGDGVQAALRLVNDPRNSSWMCPSVPRAAGLARRDEAAHSSAQ